MKKILTTVVALCAFVLGWGVNNFGFCDSGALKIACVDVGRLMSASSSIKAAEAAKENQTKEMYKWYDSASEDIKKQKTKEGQDDLIKKYEAQLNSKKKAIKDTYVTKVKQAGAQIDTLIAQKAKESGYNYVFRKDSLLFGGDDITSKILPQIK